MDFQSIVDFITQQGIWCALFVWLFYTSRQESIRREAKLTCVIEEQGEKLGLIANTLNEISERLDKIENNLYKR